MVLPESERRSPLRNSPARPRVARPDRKALPEVASHSAALVAVPNGPETRLAPAKGAASPRDRHPAAVYLARLAQGSRRTMRGALDLIAGILSSGTADAITLPWAQVRYQHAAAVRAALAERFAPATCNKALAALRGVLREAWRLGLMTAEDRERASDLPAVRGSRLPRGRALSAGEIRALFADCAEDPSRSAVRDAALLAILYSTGLRRSEAAALDLADFTSSTGELRIRAGKGRKERLAFASNGGKEALEAWLAVRGDAAGALFCPVGKGKAGRIVYRPMSSQAIYYVMKRRGARAGVGAFSPHDLRRSFVSDLLDAGADISTVQALAAHANVTTTARYDRRPDIVRRRAASLLHVPFVARKSGEEN
ncbi:MAG: tyrosine-type recombinase/integrase [Planctomycetes bacterium]|nr:tyrosine-type recombinase/integrase [Planctomycetota bacterium]